MRMFSFVNGSIIKFGHYGDSDDAEYQGQEWDWIFMDEATQFTEHQFRVLGACVRGSTKLPRRMYLTCNPGGIGHEWVKRLFVDKEYGAGEKAEGAGEDAARAGTAAAEAAAEAAELAE
jgi:phage terminase large subunit